MACFFSPNQKKRIKRVVIPEGYTSIGEKTFEDCTKLTNIELPKSLTSIETWAFRGCKGLKSIEFPESLTSIEEHAFDGCEGLTNIELPESLTSIGEWAFAGCKGLTNIKLPKNLISIGCRSGGYIPLASIFCDLGDSTFSGCTGLTNIEFPEGLTSIGTSVFYGCTALTSIKLPESLTSIGDEAFQNCTGLTSIQLPKSLASIGDRVFEGCKNLTEITVDKNNSAFCTVDGVLFDKAMTTLLWFPKEKKGRYSFPEGVSSIKSDVFGENCKLTGISFPKSLLYIEPDLLDSISKHLTNITVSELNPVYCSVDGVLFDKDKSLLILYPRNKRKTDYVIPDGIQYINDFAFYGCKYLVNIVLPDSIRFIGDKAFAECKRLKTVTLSGKLCYAEEHEIKGRTDLQTILMSKFFKIKHNAFEEFTGQFVYRDKGGLMETLAEKRSRELPVGSGKNELTKEEMIRIIDEILVF